MPHTQSSAAERSELPVNIYERGSVRLHDAGRPLSLTGRITRVLVRVGGGDDRGRSRGVMFGGHRSSLLCRIIVGWRGVRDISGPQNAQDTNQFRVELCRLFRTAGTRLARDQCCRMTFPWPYLCRASASLSPTGQRLAGMTRSCRKQQHGRALRPD